MATTEKLDLTCLSGLTDGAKASEALHRVADYLCECPPSARTTERLPPEPARAALRALVLAAAAPPAEPAREAVLADVLEAGVGAADVATALADAALARRPDVRAAAATVRAAGVAQARLVDFDWRAAVTVASDTAVALERPVVTVALRVAAGADSAPRDLLFEAGSDDLDAIIAKLEQAEAAISDLRA